MFEILAIISSWSWLHSLVMQIESKPVGTFPVKSSATTQAHSAVLELRVSTCQCTFAITHSWWWDGITNEVLVERLYRTSSGKFSSFHFAHSLCIHCPCQWHELLIWTFLDNKVFTLVMLLQYRQYNRFAIQYLSGFLDITRGAWTSVRNSVRVTFCQSLVACSKKARPIINYSTSWPQKLGQAIGIAFLEILNIVYSDLLKLQEVHAVLEQIRLLFQVIASDERIFEIHQSDIAGFYNQVEHDRILQAVDFAIYGFCDLEQVSLESSIQTHNHKLERTLHIFRGHWRSQSNQFREFKLSHIRDLVKVFTSELILPRRDPSFSSTSWCVYGLTMAVYLYVLLLH